MQIVIISFGFIVGTILGSFVKVLADRSLTRKTFFGRSFCPICKTVLRWYDLIPIISYISLHGRCRYCQTRISLEYLMIEAITGVLIAIVFFQTVPINILELTWMQSSQILGGMIFKVFTISTLVAVFLTDIKKGLIPDRITLPASLIAFGFLVLFTLYKIGLLYLSLKDNDIGKFLLPPYSDYFTLHALSAADPLFKGFFAALGLVVFFGAIIFITGGRGMGGGDLKLGLFMGLTLGPPSALLAIILAFLGGSIVGVGLILSSLKRFGQTIPFGPFLSVGSIIALFWGDQIINWYINISGGYTIFDLLTKL